MADEYFAYFLTKLPLSIQGSACTEAHVREYSGLVPDALISYWQEYGFSGFGNGIAWLVDPIEWKVTADEVLLDVIRHPRLDKDAQYIPIMRSAFGKVWFWTPGHGVSLVIEPVRGFAFFRTLETNPTERDLDMSLKAFIAGSDKEQYDLADKDDQPMFDRVYERLGALEFNELYGFVPGVRLGGAAVVENTTLFEIHVHMALLRSAIGNTWYTS
ncbi:GAD-like domain-containing protein [Mycobacteroides abscessus]|uniref:GAD-like domain-containing protein n=1 Tax=Mycobacteroides abscessus TaxID=36809 RepID=UPI000C257127|nr:GAD-like domain-containing protein [Mycobacteroides abscessus]